MRWAFSMRQDPSYLLHPVDVPPRSTYKETPSRVPTLPTDVITPTVLAVVLATGFCWAVTNEVRLGVGLGFSIGFLFLIWRLAAVYDHPAPKIEEREFQEMAWRWGGPDDRLIPVVNGSQRHEVRMYSDRALVGVESGKRFTLSGREINWLLAQAEAGNALRRETSGEGPGTDQIGIRAGRYSVFKTLLEENGLIDEAGKWTAAGVAWLKNGPTPARGPSHLYDG